MLPAAARLAHRDDFTAAVRRGRRIGRKLVVMHVLLADAVDAADPAAEPAGPRVGFVVSKAVGGSVVRHRVARRLRHLMRERLTQLPPGSRIVVRALPASATAESPALGRDLDRALRAAGLAAAGAGAGEAGAGGAGAGGVSSAAGSSARPTAASRT